MQNRSPPPSTTRWLRACLLAIIASLTFSQRALAQSLADELFQQGKALLEQRRVAEACQKFEASVALARRGGTLLNLAVCREEEGRTASALTLFEQARERALEDQRPDRVALVNKHIAGLRPRLSWLTIAPPDMAPLGLTIRCDDSLLAHENWGEPQATDPGEHVITAAAPGRIPLTVRVLVRANADLQTVALPELSPVSAKPTPAEPAGQPATSPKRTEPATSPKRTEPAASAGSPVLGFVVLGVGAAGLAVGSVFGIQAILDSQHSRALCSAPPCSAEAIEANERARSAAHVADVAIPVGLTVAGLGLFLLLRKPASAPLLALNRATSLHLEPTLTPNLACASLQGEW